MKESQLPFQYTSLIYESDVNLIIQGNDRRSGAPLIILRAIPVLQHESVPIFQDQITLFGRLKAIGIYAEQDFLLPIDDSHLALSLSANAPAKQTRNTLSRDIQGLVTVAIQFCHQIQALYEAGYALTSNRIAAFGVSVENNSVTLLALSDIATREKHQSSSFILRDVVGPLLYEWFTGTQRTASHPSPSELTRPPRIDELLPHLPPMLGVIIDTLVDDSEISYKTFWGLTHDLSLCLSQLNAFSAIQSFPLREHDVPDTLPTQPILQGRNADLSIITNRYTQAQQGKNVSLLLSGRAGIGKTALIEQFKSNCITRTGFITAKYTQTDIHTPYSGIIKALSPLLDDTQQASISEQRRFKQSIIEALGYDLDLMVTMFPALGACLSHDTATLNHHAHSSKTVSHRAFRSLIAAISQFFQPLVCFLDDVQWMDSSSRELIINLINSPQVHSFFLILAIRDPDSSSSSEDGSFLSNIAFNTKLALKPLSLPHINKLIAKTFYASHEDVASLAKLVEQKTRGNPLFIDSLLQEYIAQGNIYFDKKAHRWWWHLGALHDVETTSNVHSLLAAKVKRLPSSVQNVLFDAACIGNAFSVALLADLSGRSISAIMNDIRLALGERMILPSDRHGHTLANKTISAQYFSFAHDKYRKASLSLKTEEALAQRHWSIAESLLQGNNKAPFLVFRVAKHFNAGIQADAARSQLDKAVRANLAAAHIAHDTFAYQESWTFANHAMALLQEDDWRLDYTQTLAIAEFAAQSAYLSGNYNAAITLCDGIVARSSDTHDKVKGLEIQLRCVIAQNLQEKAITLGINALRTLGFRFPRLFTKTRVLRDYASVQWLMTRHRLTPDRLIDLPTMTNRSALAAMRILRDLSSMAYRHDQKLLAMVLLNMVSCSIRYGNSPESGFAYSGFGFLLSAGFNNVTRGDKYAQAALALLKSDQQDRDKAYILTSVYYFVHHWLHDARQATGPLLDAFNDSVRRGDIIQASVASLLFNSQQFFIGAPLESILSNISQQQLKLGSHQDRSSLSVKMLHDCISSLKADDQPAQFFHSESLPAHTQQLLNDANGRAVFGVYCLMSAYLLGNYQAALLAVERVVGNMHGLKGMVSLPVFYYYAALTHIALSQQAGCKTNKQHTRKARKFLSSLQSIAAKSPTNYAHKVSLIQAELHRLANKPSIAARYFDEAITGAKEANYVQECALAHERAAEFYLSLHNDSFARAHLIAAYGEYMHWGAASKTAHLLERHQTLLQGSPANALSSAPLPGANVNTTASAQPSTETLQLSSHTYTAPLLKELLALCLSKTQAEYACFIEARDGAFVISASGNQGDDNIFVVTEDIEPSSILALSVQEVKRSLQPLILQNAEQAMLSPNATPKIPARSVLCLPIIRNDRELGYLYLHDTQQSGLFNQSTIEQLSLYIQQAAITLENTHLFESMLDTDEKKTHFMATVSHEIRNPIHAILRLTELLASNDQLAPELQQQTSAISFAANQGLRVINDLLDYSKVSHGKLTLESAVFSLQELLHTVDSLYQPQATQKGLAFSIDIDEDVPQYFVGDSLRIHQVLTNLIGNAFKFTSEGAIRIGIQCRTQVNQSVTVELAVHDTGIGIDLKAQQQLFEPYHQADASTARQYGGTGLGLSIVKHLVTLMDGTIDVESTPGQGSIFRARLTLALADHSPNLQAVTTSSASTTLSLQDKTILVVDDHALNRDVTAAMLSETGASILTAESGRAAIAILQQHSVDLVLMDYDMADMNGIETTQYIRAGIGFKPGADYEALPIIGLSGAVKKTLIAQGLDAGMNDHLTKPILKEDLIGVLEQWLLPKSYRQIG